MTVYGLTPEGFVTKTLEDIEASFVAQQRAHIDPAIDTSQFGLIGQLNGIVASDLAELWELGENLYDAMDPDQASGDAQDQLYSLTNSLREPATPSRVVCTVVLAASTSIPALTAVASVQGNAAARFTNTIAMVNATGAPATLDIPFQAVDTGPIGANAGTLTQRDTLITGWTSVTNALDAELGTDIESDAAYRIRRQDELAAQGGGTVAGIRADLLQLDTVLAVSVLENVTDAVDANGLPGHSFEAVVRSVIGAVDDQAIGLSIWTNKPAGIQAYGSVTVVIVDTEGIPHTIGFSRPTEIPVYVALRLTVVAADYVGDTAMKEAIAASAETPGSPGYLDVGDPVYAGRFVTVAMQQPGVLNAECRVSLVSSDYATGVPSVAVTQRQIGTLDTTRISVVPIP
jgi:uncharacterized phage protein gp47/JayE